MNVTWKSVLVLFGALAAAHAQPELGVAKVNAPCDAGPILIGGAGGAPDTVASAPDSLGFYSIFDGKTLKGWWENCQTSQSSADRNLGAIWLVDTAQRALYSNQAPSGAGSILMTNKSYGNYEIVFDFWSAYGNDAGLFNRSKTDGSSFQTLLDYINGGNIGGAYAEEYYGGSTPGTPLFSVFPYTLTNPEGSLTVAGWTAFTAARNPASFGCPAGGCTAAQWTTVWDTAGWNQVRVRFWGGLDSGSGRVKMQSWFRRMSGAPVAGPDNWVPVYDDSVAVVTPANPLGLQAHGGVYWSQAGRGTWYRNIRVRPLDAAGTPIIAKGPAALRATPAFSGGIRLRRAPGGLRGDFPLPHQGTARDLQGRELARFNGAAGRDLAIPLPKTYSGLLLIEIRTAEGVERSRVMP